MPPFAHAADAPHGGPQDSTFHERAKKDTAMPLGIAASFACEIFPYVGITQIRLRVGRYIPSQPAETSSPRYADMLFTVDYCREIMSPLPASRRSAQNAAKHKGGASSTFVCSPLLHILNSPTSRNYAPCGRATTTGIPPCGTLAWPWRKGARKKSSDALDGSVLLMVTYALLGSATANMLQSLCFVRVRSAVTAHSWIVR